MTQVRKNGKEFNFKKSLLCAYSEVFKSLFNSQFKEAQSNTVDMINIFNTSPKTVQALNQVLYGHPIRDDELLDIDLWMLSDNYQFKSLFKLCHEHILSLIHI